MIKTLLLVLILNSIYVYGQASLKWEKLFAGIEYSNTGEKGNNIFIGYGGWSTKPNEVKFWCEKLFDAELSKLGVAKIFAIKGPDSPCYEEKEIADSLLALNLIDICSREKVQNIIIAAHSSGAFVAHNLFQYLFGKADMDVSELLKNKIIYFNLDGGIGSYDCGAPLDSNIAFKLNRIFAVYAYDSLSNKYSSNYETMILLGHKFTNSEEIKIDVSGCGCVGKWCLHDALITKLPYNSEKFDLVNDYGGINDKHPVQTDYLRVLKIKKPN